MASVAFRKAAIDEVVVYQHWVVDCSEEYMEALTSWEGSENPRLCFKKWVDDVVRPEVEAGSGLYWELRTWGRSAYRPNEFGATMRCVSRRDRVCVNRPHSAGNRCTSEKSRAIERFRCQGELRITLDTSTAMCAVTCIHLEDHERPSWRDSKFPREALEFLDKVAEAGMRTTDVYRLLRLQDHIDPRAHVNYWVAEIESWRYGAGEPDQLKSSKDFIERPKNRTKGFELILYEETDDFEAFSFLTLFWRYVSTVKEVLTDSTFKTNNMRFEMFALIGNLGGFGVPLCYMFYLKKTSVDESTPNAYQTRGCRKGLLLVYLLAKKDVGDVEISLNQFQKGREFPTWWVKFRRQWVKLAEREPAARGYYVTDVSAWTCSCPAFVSAKYLIRKHLVLDYTIGVSAEVLVYLQTYRRFEPPFYVFQSSENFFSKQTMRPESDPWYEHPAYVEHGMAQDIGIGVIDLNEEPIEMIPSDDPETEDDGPEENVATIAGLLAEVNVSGDDDSGGEAVSRGRHSSVRSIRVMQKTFDDACALLEREATNPLFIRQFMREHSTWMRKVERCMQGLRRRRQQGTWEHAGAPVFLR
ncbi:hypothetical protein R1sor_014499 [Riccia sorocarpa]|uniref:Uncharacterized protein n=1 Tax=Riccia sorocarpa TaxID=122646 RepID=A0ABD3HDD9_9MARC